MSSIAAQGLARYAPDPAPYHAAGVPPWLDELILRPAPAYLHMGTHALDLDTWLVPDGFADAEIALRNRLVNERRDEVFACLPSAEDAAEETHTIVSAWLATHGQHRQAHDVHPLARAGRMVQEDLCLMVHRDGAWHLDAAVLCFPTLWFLHEKIGRPTPDVHAPVAHYAEELSVKVDRFFDRLRPEHAVWRRNLSLMTELWLFAPGHAESNRRCRPGDVWLRSERQTLRRLPGTGAILFTIRVQMAPAGCLRARPDVAGAMAAMYRSWDASSRHYKAGGGDVLPTFVPWLEAVACAR